MGTTSRRGMRRRLARVALALASCGAALLAGEAAVRLLSDVGRPLKIKDAAIGERFRPGLDEDVLVPEAGRRVRLRFNSLGFRGPEWERQAAAGTRRIAVLGDSFVAGLAVDEDDTFPALLARRLAERAGQPPWDALNFGVTGFGTSQELLAWREHARGFAPDVVILAFYSGNDLSNNSPDLSAEPRPLFLLREDGMLDLRRPGPARAGVSNWLRAHSRLYNLEEHVSRSWREARRQSGDGPPPVGLRALEAAPTGEVERAWAATEAMLDALRRETEADGAKLLVVVIPAHAQVDEAAWERLTRRAPRELGRDAPERRLASWGARRGVEVVRLLEPTRALGADAAYIDGVGHWTEAGHAMAADVVAERVASLPEAGLRPRR